MKKQEKSSLDLSTFKDIDTGDDSGFLGFNKLGLGRDMLPVSKAKREILYHVDKYSTTVIIAETGSGKTTLEAGYVLNGKCIAITVPRRMAAVSVAKRVAEEMNLTFGVEVGYHVRFENKTSEHTIVKFLTDGMLIKEMMQDPLLQRYSVVMVDDIHERTVNTDIIMGLLKKIKRKRPELKVIVSSATLNADAIAEFFDDEKHNFKSKVMNIEGRLYPVDIHYLSEPCKNFITKAAELSIDIHENKPDGDVLVFLTGQEEIQSFVEIINNLGKSTKSQKKIFCVPLYGNMPLESQMDVFNKAPYNTRKIVVSTNLAESSVTIDGIVYVIDCCFVKTKYYDYLKGDESLIVTPVSKASANQRAGRAGRVKAGECFRLCQKKDFEQFYEESSPEICRTNLANIFLQMKALGIGNLAKFEYITTPTEESFVRALELLFSLGALDRDGNLTNEIGWKLAEMPIDPRLGVILLNSGKKEFECSHEMLMLVSMLSAQNIFYAGTPSGVVIKNKKKLGAKEGDLITLINFAIRYSYIKKPESRKAFCTELQINQKSIDAAEEIRRQLAKYMKKYNIEIKSCDDDTDAIIKCIVTGFFDKAAQRQPDGSYISVRGKEKLYMHPQSIMNAVFPSWVIYTEVVRTGKNYMRELSKIDPKWLVEIAPHFYQDNKLRLIEDKRKRELDDNLKFEAEHRKKVKTIEQNTKKKKPQQNFTISDMDYGDSD